MLWFRDLRDGVGGCDEGLNELVRLECNYMTTCMWQQSALLLYISFSRTSSCTALLCCGSLNVILMLLWPSWV